MDRRGCCGAILGRDDWSDARRAAGTARVRANLTRMGRKSACLNRPLGESHDLVKLASQALVLDRLVRTSRAVVERTLR